MQVGERSMVDSLVVVFNEAVTIASPAAAFSLSLKPFTDNTVAGSMVGDATTTVTATNPSGDGMTWVLTFSGGTTEPVTGGSIGDGDYYLNLAAGTCRGGGQSDDHECGQQSAEQLLPAVRRRQRQRLHHQPELQPVQARLRIDFDFGAQLQRRLRLQRQRVHHQQPGLQPVQIALRDALERAVRRVLVWRIGD